MSFIDRYAEYKASRSNPSDMVFRRIWDPDFLTPDVFFSMDEIKGRQILRKYHKGAGTPIYAGTYLIIFKTEDSDKFYLIMKRVKDEWKVPEEYADSSDFEEGTFIVSEYYPGTHGRIYLKGIGEQALDRVVKKYERKTRKKLPLKSREKKK